jgi:DNA-binding response OmpR family regulator
MEAERVLVVDKDVDFRGEVQRLLAAQGQEVVATGSAREAVAYAKQAVFACAIVDVHLEDSEGLAALPQFRAVDPHLPVIMTTTLNNKALERQAREQNVFYYYVKCFDRAELANAVSRALVTRRGVRRAKILVVDDDRDYQAATRQALEGARYEVVSAYTKQKGLAALKSEAPDLVILDIMMLKTTDGFDFLYEMKADPDGKKPPVLSISCISKALGMKFSPTTDGDYFPADDFLAKPVGPGELLAHVRALLAGYRSPRGEE